MNIETSESDGVRLHMKQEYLKSTLANVIRSERCSCITNITGLQDFTFNNIKSATIQSNDKNVFIQIAEEYDSQQIRMWQYNLKVQKE